MPKKTLVQINFTVALQTGQVETTRPQTPAGVFCGVAQWWNRGEKLDKIFTEVYQDSNNKIRKIISNKPNFDHVQLKIRPLSTSLNQKLNNYHVPFGVMTVGWYGIVPPNPLLSSSVSSHGRDWNKSKSLSRTPFAEKIKCRRVVVTVVVWP